MVQERITWINKLFLFRSASKRDGKLLGCAAVALEHPTNFILSLFSLFGCDDPFFVDQLQVSFRWFRR